MVEALDPKPRNYAPPRSHLERMACAALFRLILHSKRIQIDFDNRASGQNVTTDSEFILAPPGLWTTIKLIFAPGLWVGESFVSGKWYLKKGHLPDFLYAVEEDASFVFKTYYEFISTLRWVRHYLRQFVLNRFYTRKVQAHYDIDSKIYEMMLDEEMFYTCAVFSKEDDTLAAAQQTKAAAIIERMSLPAARALVLDIGCGWGGIARAIVRNHENAEVCGLSISSNQITWAKRRNTECLSKLQDSRIEYRVEDYINHERRNHYDAISVVGMIEHVGLGGYNEFFAKVFHFLKPGGTAVIHTIVSPLPATPSNRWIDRHIFAGGYTPSISELIDAAERRRFYISALHVYPPMHYRRTLECWLNKFVASSDNINQYLGESGYDKTRIEKFMRTWVFYLSVARNMFVGDDERCHQVVHLSIKRL
jgi:cyclopropane-fatty-acyl-phospholipid synthase